MDSIVPVMGLNAKDKSSALASRIRYTIEEDFGHTMRFVDAGAILDLRLANPLKTTVPFVLAIDGIDPILRDDLFEAIHHIFPSAVLIEEQAEHVPSILKDRAKELSLGHLNGAPSIIRRSANIIYKRMHDESLNVPGIAREVGTSKSTLERASRTTLDYGIGHMLSRYRMIEAHRMALESDAPVNAISFAVGYSSLPSFDRAFSAFWSTSVTHLRRNIKSVSQKDKSLVQ